MTSRETPSVAITGFSVFGSARSATIKSPPYRPSGLVVLRRSSASAAEAGIRAIAKAPTSKAGAGVLAPLAGMHENPAHSDGLNTVPLKNRSGRGHIVLNLIR